MLEYSVNDPLIKYSIWFVKKNSIHLVDRGAYSVSTKILAKIITAFQTYKYGYPCIYALNYFWSEESLGFQSLNTVQNVIQ